ncbi:kinase-like domain-containing protein [Stachybotrys elegans]|uniref:Kinase-like domain-containing protein n=1 Tax=Stachybotrys elegans TaxID=80388 RepID=A0A8K0SEL7_9HYPO|nr:kinase-like domain-containing protein [Stachybotrys elegans]
MGAAENLPHAIPQGAIQALLRTISLPEATSIISAKVTAQYHSIYFIALPPTTRTHNHSDLVLRVSGRHLPTIKTSNELGVMSWVARNTTIPIPDLVASDSSEKNPIGHEYTLMSRIKGATLSDIYESLDDDQVDRLMDQLVGFLLQLHSHPWSGIGGLALDDREEAVLARVVDETFWQVPDIEKYWHGGETTDSLNIAGPYATYVDFIAAQVRQYIHLIKIHDALEFMRDSLPRLEAFVDALPNRADELNKVSLRLTHKDLHLANILYDVDSGSITAILDWEFSGVVPFTNWNPRRSFLWNGRDDERSLSEKQRLGDIFARRCAALEVSLLDDASFASPLQEGMQMVADFLRAITEVSPRGQRQDLVLDWKTTVLDKIGLFGV